MTNQTDYVPAVDDLCLAGIESASQVEIVNVSPVAIGSGDLGGGDGCLLSGSRYLPAEKEPPPPQNVALPLRMCDGVPLRRSFWGRRYQ